MMEATPQCANRTNTVRGTMCPVCQLAGVHTVYALVCASFCSEIPPGTVRQKFMLHPSIHPPPSQRKRAQSLTNKMAQQPPAPPAQQPDWARISQCHQGLADE